MPAGASGQSPTILITALWTAAHRLHGAGSPSRVERTGRRGQGDDLTPSTSQFTKHLQVSFQIPTKACKGVAAHAVACCPLQLAAWSNVHCLQSRFIPRKELQAASEESVLSIQKCLLWGTAPRSMEPSRLTSFPPFVTPQTM